MAMLFCEPGNSAYRSKRLIPMVKHGEGSIMVWGWLQKTISRSVSNSGSLESNPVCCNYLSAFINNQLINLKEKNV